VSDGTLFAAPFDLDRLELTGPPVPMLEGVQVSPGTGAVQFAASAGGTLVYLIGGERALEAPVVWMDRSGKTTLLRDMPTDWSNPSFSPDGSQLAMDLSSAGGTPDVWIYEWMRDTSHQGHLRWRERQTCLDTGRPPHRVLLDARHRGSPTCSGNELTAPVK
jgi:serine/threonine-protein kinase